MGDSKGIVIFILLFLGLQSIARQRDTPALTVMGIIASTPHVFLEAKSGPARDGHRTGKDGLSSHSSFYSLLFLPSSPWFLKNNSFKTPVSRYLE